MKSTHLRTAGALVALTALLTAACQRPTSPAGGGDTPPAYPTKPITLIVPFGPGGPADVTARLFAGYASTALKQPVTVQNVEGASGITGTLQAIRAQPDGYTFFIDSQATSAPLAATFKDLPFKIEERTYVSVMAEQYQYFIVNTKSPYTTLAEVMAAAKANPASLSWAAAAAGSSVEYGTLQLLQAAGVSIKDTRKVTFQSGLAESANAVASGQVLFGLVSQSLATSLSAAGKVRVLAVAADQRHPKLPDVPSTKELGYPQADLVIFQALAGPPNLPDHVVATWAKVLQDAVKDPEMVSKAEAGGVRLTADRDGKAMQAYVKATYDQLLELAIATGTRR